MSNVPLPEPMAWKHDCAALCTNDVELWIDACPHCGKPRTAPPAAPAVPLSCNKVPPGNGYCDHCARGEYEKCRYTTPAAPVVPLTDEQVAAGIEAWFTTEIAGKNQPFEGRMRAAYAAINGITGGKP
jgi:hypothetical protein